MSLQVQLVLFLEPAFYSPTIILYHISQQYSINNKYIYFNSYINNGKKSCLNSTPIFQMIV